MHFIPQKIVFLAHLQNLFSPCQKKQSLFLHYCVDRLWHRNFNNFALFSIYNIYYRMKKKCIFAPCFRKMFN